MLKSQIPSNEHNGQNKHNGQTNTTDLSKTCPLSLFVHQMEFATNQDHITQRIYN